MGDKAEILHRGMWQIPYKAVNVLCSDGVRRTVNNLKTPDTAFSIPGQAQVHGKTLTGYIMSMGSDLIFSQFTYGKNGAELPNIPAKDYPGLRE